MSGKSINSEQKIKAILEQKFEKIHIEAALRHFVAAKGKYQEGDCEGPILKSGKFVEAVTKALLQFCGKTLPRLRQFHAGTSLRDLEREPASIDEAIRIVIPKCCLFIYEVASNFYTNESQIAKLEMALQQHPSVDFRFISPDKYKRLERYLNACSLPSTKFLVKIGIIATPMAPVIKTIAIKSGIRKAA